MAEAVPLDLAEIPTSELVGKLQNRSLASVISLVLPEAAEMSTTKAYYSGNDFTNLGMAQAAAYRMQRKIYDELEPGDSTD